MRPGEEERTERLLRLFTILPVDETMGRQAAVYLGQFRRDYRIELGDAFGSRYPRPLYTTDNYPRIRFHPLPNLCQLLTCLPMNPFIPSSASPLQEGK